MIFCLRNLAAVAFLAGGGIVAQADTPAAISAHHGQVYETAKAGATTEAFVEIDNAARKDDLLTGIVCPIAGASSIVAQDGKPILQLPVVSGHPLILTASGPHILLQSTHFTIDHGGAIPCSLTFQNAGAILVYLYATPAP